MRTARIRQQARVCWNIIESEGMIVPWSVPGRKHVDGALGTGIEFRGLFLGLVQLCR